MAIWRIPSEYIIEWSPNGDTVHTFSKKVKDCLELTFDDLYEVSDLLDSVKESITAVESSVKEIYSIAGSGDSVSGNANSISGIGVEIASIGDGDILVYRESDKKFHNEENHATSKEQTDIGHLTRLVGNLYLTLDVAGLNPGGYDGLSGETFFGDTNDIDMTKPQVTSLIQGDDSLALDSPDGLTEGSIFLLSDGTNSSWVKIKQIRTGNRGTQVVLKEPVDKQFDINSTRLRRSRGAIDEGSISSRTGNYSSHGSFYTTNLITFVNEVTGEEKLISRALLLVKHQNIVDAEIIAEIALRETATFVKGEIVGIGNGLEQTVRLANRTNLASYKFALYFDGKKQTKDFTFDPTTGQVIFTAPLDSIVSVDYFYDWSEENFVEMDKVGTFVDRRNPNRATTQFTYNGTAGKVATLRLTLKRKRGNAELTSTGTGKVQGFKLEHQAIADEIRVTPASALYDEVQNTIVVTAQAGDPITINYNWRGKSFIVDSFVCMFDE